MIHKPFFLWEEGFFVVQNREIHSFKVMKKLLSVLLGIIIVLIIVGFCLYLFRTPLATMILSKKLGTSLTLDQINFRPQHITLDQLKMSNPAGYRYPYALEIQKTDVEAPYTNYLKSIVEVDKIELDDVTIRIEISLELNNWNVLLGRVGQPETTKAVEAKSNYAVIKLLVINNLKVQVVLPDGSIKERTIKRLEYRDLKTNEGDIGRRIMQTVILQMLLDVRNIMGVPLTLEKDTLQGIFTPQNGKEPVLDDLNPLNWGK